MKKMFAVIFSTVLLLSICVTAAPPQPPKTTEVPQQELAKVVVEALGLTRFLPVNPSASDYFAILMANGIAPAKGWEADKAVTRFDLAQVVVLSLKQGNKVEHPENPQAWIDYLVSIGIRVDTVGLATSPLEPLALPIGPTAYSSQLDTTKRLPRLVPTGDVQFGAIMLPIRELFIVGPQPGPATPTAPVKGARI